jgi:hypothetical protein
MAARIEPPPVVDRKELPYVIQDWLRRFYIQVLGVTGSGTGWLTLNFSGSNLTDIVTRNHNNLQNIQGGGAADYQHLTTSQWNMASNLLTRTSKSVAGAVDITLSTTEAQCRILELTGVLTGNINVIVPTAVWQWTVANLTTGAFTLTVKTAAGTGIVVGQTRRCILYCDNTNVVRATGDV